MRTDLDHLPDRQQQELELVRTILLDEFEAAKKQGAGGTSDWRRNGQVLKIVLFGSYARDDWVDEPDNGYLSDFDLLVVVSHPKLTDIADYWWVAENRILRDPAIGRTVNIIVHTLEEVNAAIRRGEYFWADIARDGVALYDLPGRPFSTTEPLTVVEAYKTATKFFVKNRDVDVWLETARDQVRRASKEPHLTAHAAFNIHQAVETAYVVFLLVHTFYFPRSHNIKFLRSLAEDVDKSLAAAWPRESKVDKRRFEKLKRAYVEARYSDKFTISAEDLNALMQAARRLRDLVEIACRRRLADLEAAAAG